MLEVGECDVEYIALRRHTAQRGIGLLAALNLERQLGCMTPQQHLRKIVQQGRAVNHRRVVIHAQHRKAEREIGGTLSALDNLEQALKRLRVVGQLFFDRRLQPKGGEKWCDAEQHQRRGDGFGVGDPAAGSICGHMGQDLERHQRVG